MPIFEVPVTIVEYGRVVTVEAESRQEACRKARAADWIECSDVSSSVVKVAGSVVRVEGGK